MDKIAIVGGLIPMVAIIAAIGVAGWVFTTWMRIKHGYPLDGAWGQAIYPKTDNESVERIKLLTTENAQLRAEVASVKDRLATLERIATDQPGRLAREIDQLSTLGNA